MGAVRPIFIDDFIRNILSAPFCPYYFVQYHFVRIPFCPYHFVLEPLKSTATSTDLFWRHTSKYLYRLLELRRAMNACALGLSLIRPQHKIVRPRLMHAKGSFTYYVGPYANNHIFQPPLLLHCVHFVDPHAYVQSCSLFFFLLFRRLCRR